MPDASAPPAPRSAGSMSLLVDMATASLDPEYRDAHAQRLARAANPPLASAPGPVPPAGGRRTRLGRAPLVLTALLLLAGLVTGIAAGQVRVKDRAAGALRQSLVQDVRRQTASTDALARREAALRLEVAGVRSGALGQDVQGRLLAEQLAALELATGSVAVRGPGLVVLLDDAHGAPTTATGASGGSAGEGRIYDRDLQDVTNALWTAGAEQIAINGQRLTAQTTIRSAGEAVLVDFRPLSPPYVLEAVGGVDTMEPRFVDGLVARRFQTWTSLYGIRFKVTRAKQLHLPAAGPVTLRHVRLATTG